MTTALIKKEITPSEVFVPNGLDMIISGVQAKKTEFEKNQFDIEKESDRKKISSFAYQITRSKTYVDGKGKDYVAELKKKTKEIDAERKRFRDIMDDMVSEVKKPVTEWEEKEAARVEAERQLEIYLMDWDEAIAMDDLFNRERDIRRKEEEFVRLEAERKAKEEAQRLERERIENEDRLKKEAAEAARREAEEAIRKEKERAERLEREAKEAAEKAERDRIAAEERAKIEAERIEREKKEAAERAEREKQEAIRLERERIEQEAKKKKEAEDREAARIKAEAEALAANKKHRAKINNEILSAFVSAGLEEDTAKTVIRVVAKGQIPHMGIRY
jgi:hypothetical protein